MNRIEIRLQTALIENLQGCEDALNDWANRRLDDGFQIRDLSLRMNDTEVVVLAVADSAAPHCSQAAPHACDTGSTLPTDTMSSQDEETEPDTETTTETMPDEQDGDRSPAKSDPLDNLFYYPGENPPAAVRNSRQPQTVFAHPLFDHVQDRDDADPSTPPAEQDECPWKLSQRSKTWWRRYGKSGTGQVGPKNSGRPGYWWRIIGPGGDPLAKGDANTIEEGQHFCDMQMKEPAAA